MLVELRCPGCNAPVDTSQGRVLRCRYCGASLLVQEPPAGERRETYAVSLEPVGPSNRDGIAKLIVEHVGLPLADAEALVKRAPCDVVTWDNFSRADEFRRALVERGARANVVPRFVEIPAPVLLPAGDVWLDDAGSNKIGVVKVVRKYLDLGMKEAKELIDSAPCALVKAIEGSRANAFRDELVAVGARARKG